MSSITQTILSGESIRTAYVLVTMLLSGLVLFATWRGRETVGKHVVAPLYAAIPAFAASRLVVAVASPSAARAVGRVDLPFASIGPTTTGALRELDVEPWAEACEPTFTALAQAIAERAR